MLEKLMKRGLFFYWNWEKLARVISRLLIIHVSFTLFIWISSVATGAAEHIIWFLLAKHTVGLFEFWWMSFPYPSLASDDRECKGLWSGILGFMNKNDFTSNMIYWKLFPEDILTRQRSKSTAQVIRLIIAEYHLSSLIPEFRRHWVWRTELKGVFVSFISNSCSTNDAIKKLVKPIKQDI